MRLITLIALAAGVVVATDAPGYRILVASESGDIVTQLIWDGTALSVAKVVPVGIMPADIDGPHNVTVAPDGSAWYVTIAHGTPYGSLWKMSAGSDTLLGRAQVEMFPTTIALTPDGALAYVSCMHSDEVLEIDRQSLRIRRRHKTGAGMSTPGMPMHVASGPSVHDCMPTFVSVSPDDRRLYVACNHGNTLQVLDAGSLELVKEIPVGTGAYNVEPSADGKWIIVTNKKAQSVSLVAFISQESVGSDPGAVDVVDLTTRA